MLDWWNCASGNHGVSNLVDGQMATVGLFITKGAVKGVLTPS
jgi:hypothetical protein